MPRKNINARATERSGTVQAVPEVRTVAEDKLRAALRACPGSSTTELALAAGIGKSTAARFLASWHGEGTVTREHSSAEEGTRATDRWTLTNTDTATDQDSSITEVADPPDAATEPPPDGAGTVDAACAGDTTTGLASITTQSAPDSEGTALASDAGTNPLIPGMAHEQITEIPEESTANAEVAASSGAAPEPPADLTDADAGIPDEPAPAVATSSTRKKRRLAAGELRGQVEDYLREHEGEVFGPGAIGKALGRSSGAVNNALERLVADGYAVQTNDKPKRFALKSDTAEHPTDRPTREL